MSIRVLICDDDPIVRAALAGYLLPELDIVLAGSVDDAETAVAVLDEAAPDVVLMDLVLPGTDGITAAAQVRARRPQTQVLILTTFGTDENVGAALRAGASGFLLKSATAGALVAAVRAAASGAGIVITPEVAARLADPAPAPGSTGAAIVPGSTVAAGARQGGGGYAVIEDLTEREVDVLRLLCLAESNALIAEHLSLSESTVKKHLASLMNKLGAHSRLETAVRAFELNLVPHPGDDRS